MSGTSERGPNTRSPTSHSTTWAYSTLCPFLPPVPLSVQPIILSLPGMETLMVTLVQLVRSPHHSGVVPQDYNHPTTLVKVSTGLAHSTCCCLRMR